MKLFISMLVILNPFSQVLYLMELIRELPPKDFAGVHFRATALSYGVFLLFAFVGELLLEKVFQVRLASLEIFGGLVILFIAYRYIAEGPGSNVLFRGNIADLAHNISLPYMVGPGTIWVSILIGRQYSAVIAVAIIAGVLAINMAFVFLAYTAFHAFQSRRETLAGKYFAILMRTNALFIGAIAVEMIIQGIETAFPNIKGNL